MNEWQPIQSVPTDGRNVLVTWDYTWVAGQPHIEACYWRGEWYYTYDGDSPDKAPSHWMPLPDPPAPVHLTCGLCLRTVPALAPGRTICETCAHFPLD